MTPFDCLAKECQEEAGLTLTNEMPVSSVGSISYINSLDRGIYPETQYIFDLKVDSSFQPINQDGEVSSFRCLTIDQVSLQSHFFETVDIDRN